MKKNELHKNALYDSEDDSQLIFKNYTKEQYLNSHTKEQHFNKYTQNLQKINSNNIQKNKSFYTNLSCPVLTQQEINLLEREFILRRLKFNKSNVRKLAKDLGLPHKKSINYFMSKVRNAGEELNSEKYIRDIKNIMNSINKSWNKFVDGCYRYNM
ncbi:hypothetical protein AAJ76_500067131 [Vairimorpha ceranae]|uniref:Uncharacterized protein n=1 Tax=Vairimorpha ceranae TaxID=40302 RepID=A0A0F9WFW4_9MICR|nr:hypothetical protein AAJ76_500067131 [Vairimorpha ceranae]KAF5141498.1 hypothetical protein G9O61_00g003610 [Vairimorpha ceranae]KKO76241.1 hypothetical protein AAJ76_500067131 [Vairimorpha ceranae]